MIKASFKVDLGDMINLRDKKVRKAITIGIRRAGKPVRAAVIQEADRIKDKGYLSKSIGIKYGYAKGGVSFWAIIGPRTKYKRKKGKFSRGKRKGEAKVFKPARYAHIQEFGSRRTAKNEFLSPALTRTIRNYRETVEQSVKDEIEKVK